MRCSVDQAAERVRSGLPATAVVFGPELWLKRTAIAKLLGAIKLEIPEINLTGFEGVPDYSLLQAALGKPPFMSPCKAVVLRSTEMLSTQAHSSQSDPLTRMPLASGTLFIIEAGNALDRRKPYVKQLEKEALVVECAPVKGYAGSRLVVDLAREKGLHVASPVASALFERCEGDMFAVESELEKLSAVCTGQISREELDRYGPVPPETSVFAIEDLFIKKQYEKAAEAVSSLLAREASPFGFLSIVTTAFRSMLVARTCRDARFAYERTISLICETAGCRDWIAKKAYERSARFSADKLRAGVEKLAKIDFQAKQGEINLESDLYALLFELYAA